MMFDLKKKGPALAAILVIYGVMYLLSTTVLAEAVEFAFVTGSTILLCLAVNLIVVLFENPIAGLISAVGYPFAVVFGSMLGVLNDAEGTFDGWNKCLYFFFAVAAVAVLYFRVKKVKAKEAEKAKQKMNM